MSLPESGKWRYIKAINNNNNKYSIPRCSQHGNAFFATCKQLTYHEKDVKTGSVPLHLDSAIHNGIHFDTNYNEHQYQFVLPRIPNSFYIL